MPYTYQLAFWLEYEKNIYSPSIRIVIDNNICNERKNK